MKIGKVTKILIVQLILIAMFAGMLFISTPTVSAVTGDLKVHFIDFDCCGDAILVQMPNGKNMLIDCGHGGSDVDKVMNYINSVLGSSPKLDYIVGTHGHADHIGGMDAIIGNYNFDYYYQPVEPSPKSGPSANVEAALSAKTMTITRPTYNSEIFNFDNELKCEVFGPKRVPPTETYNDFNDYSLVLKLTYKNKSFLFTGDASEASETEILQNINTSSLSADVLKVGHHGSNTSTTQGFLNAVNPTYVVIPSDVDRNDGTARSPTVATLKRLYSNGANVYRVGEQGTVVFVTDGTTISVKDANNNVVSPATLNGFYYGGQLLENYSIDSTKDYVPSRGAYVEEFNDSFTTDNLIPGTSNWYILKGDFEDEALLTSNSACGTVGRVLKNGNYYAELQKTSTDNYNEVHMRRDLIKPLQGLIRVQAKVKVTDTSSVENLMGAFYILQRNQASSISCLFSNESMRIKNYGSVYYPGTTVYGKEVDGTTIYNTFEAGTWYTVRFEFNTRKATFCTYINDVLVGEENINLLFVLDKANVYTIGFSSLGVAGTLCVDDVKVETENYIFDDGVESGNFNNWNNVNGATISTSQFLGTYSAKLDADGEYITKRLDLTGYNTVAVDFTWKISPNFGTGDVLKAEWYNGSTGLWHDVANLTPGAISNPDQNPLDYNTVTYYVPNGANNEADFRLRFKKIGSGGGYGLIDAVYVRAQHIE